MAARTDDSLLFLVEWFDPLPQMKKQYILKYFTQQHCIEMVDIKTKKIFLKKSPAPDSLTKEDFYIGSKILFYSRELEIVDYGDLKTKEKLGSSMQSSILLLPYSAYQYWGKIIQELLTTSETKLTIINMRTFYFNSNNQVNKILSILDNNDNNSNNNNNSSSLASLQENITLGMIFHGENAFTVIEHLLMKCLKVYGFPCYYQTTSVVQTTNLSNYLFDMNNNNNNNGSFPSTVTLDNSTCVIIKPHAVKAKQTGAILDHIISQGYEISAIRLINFDKIQAEEFLEVYKGVIPEYTDHTIQLSSGLSIALEVRAQNAVETFRETAGPWDVDMAKDLRPNTIRAIYGINRICNAIHCTDLSEDAELECEYCFKLL